MSPSPNPWLWIPSYSLRMLVAVACLVVLAELWHARKQNGLLLRRLVEWDLANTWGIVYFVTANLEVMVFHRQTLFDWSFLAWGPMLIARVRLWGALARLR